MHQKTQYLCMWHVKGISLLIGVLVVYGASINKDIICNMNAINITAEDFKRSFGDTLLDEMSKEYLRYTIEITPMARSFYKSILPDLLAEDVRTELLESLLQKSEKYENLTIPHNKDERLELIDEIIKLNFLELRIEQMEIEKVAAVNFKEYQENLLPKSLKSDENMRNIWKKLYDCIPEEYLKKYTEFSEIEELFKESQIAEDDFEKICKGIEAFVKSEEFFGNGINFFRAELNRTDEHKGACMVNIAVLKANIAAEDFKRSLGDKLFDNFSKEYLQFLISTTTTAFNYYYHEYKSILDADPDGNSIFREELRSILEKTIKFMTLTIPDSKAQRLELIRESMKFRRRILRLNYFELLYTFQNMREIWKEMYNCILKKYLDEYPELNKFEKLFNEFETTQETVKLSVMHNLFEQLETFFNNEINFISIY